MWCNTKAAPHGPLSRCGRSFRYDMPGTMKVRITIVHCGVVHECAAVVTCNNGRYNGQVIGLLYGVWPVNSIPVRTLLLLCV